MKRLRDEVSTTDPTARAAAQLLRRLPPLAPDAQRQRRVRLMLGTPRQRPVFLLPRPAMALGILLLSVAGASAMASGGWSYARRHITWLALPPRETPAPGTTPARRRAVAPRAVARGAESPAPAPLPPEIVPLEQNAAPAPIAELPPEAVLPPPPPAPHQAGPIRRGARAEARTTPQRPTIAQPHGPGATLMIQAMEARRSGDLARAERLLNEYRRRYPDGDLQEEALVLSLEAAALRGDPAAAELARAYLTRFSQGRFKARVEQALRTMPR